MNYHPYDYSQIYLQVYCTLLSKSEAAGFARSVSSPEERERAEAIAKLAGLHTDAVVAYLMTNLSRQPQSIESQVDSVTEVRPYPTPLSTDNRG
ncbi:hypothetical protein IQ255_12335 [Pleurocapsales cyanobacterium LEGE 10410]|nr:hypothetical protein [Pleurocapsales cyanobacterium LEGE 10410]